MFLNMITKNFFLLNIIAFTVFFSSAALNAKQIRYASVYGRDYVYLRDVAKYYGMNCQEGKTTILSSNYSKMVFPVEKRYCYINGIKVNLLNSSVKHKWYYCISSMDFMKIIDPIMRHWALKKGNLKKIVIDPGHGGKDKGGIGKRISEKTITLPLAKKVASLLRKEGYQVYLTRESDRFIDLEKRPELAQRVNADIFISIHANMTKSTSVSGIESFCLTPSGAASSHSRTPSSKKYKGNACDANNAALTYWIHKSLIDKTKAVDRGLKHARYMVLKESSCPSVLLEVGFLSNRSEEMRIATEWYQWQIAQGIVNGIKMYDYQLKRQK
jgi:N-acetylmuramoyl-L-alanine amidase